MSEIQILSQNLILIQIMILHTKQIIVQLVPCFQHFYHFLAQVHSLAQYFLSSILVSHLCILNLEKLPDFDQNKVIYYSILTSKYFTYLIHKSDLKLTSLVQVHFYLINIQVFFLLEVLIFQYITLVHHHLSSRPFSKNIV